MIIQSAIEAHDHVTLRLEMAAVGGVLQSSELTSSTQVLFIINNTYNPKIMRLNQTQLKDFTLKVEVNYRKIKFTKNKITKMLSRTLIHIANQY